MKKKFLSTLLMSALFVASVSVLTSCKDYDEDINTLRTELNSLKSSLDEKIRGLESAQADCANNCANTAAEVAQLKSALNSKWGKDEVEKAINAALGSYVTKEQMAAFSDETLFKTAKEYIAKVAQEEAEKARLAAIEEAKKYADELLAQLTGEGGDIAKLTAQIQELDGKIGGIDSRLLKVEDALNNETTGLIAVVNNLKTQAEALAAFKEAVEKEFGTNLANLKKLAELENSVQGKLDALKTQLEGEYKQAIADAITALRQELAEGQIKAYDDKELRGRIEALEKAAGQFSEEEVAKLKELMGLVNKEMMEKLANGVENVNVLQVYIDKLVTSIVLKPQYYYAGIEAIELPALYDNAYDVTSPLVVTRDENNNVIAPTESWARSNTFVDVCNGGVAYYHVNPYSADWEGGKVKFIGNIAETRAGNPEENYAGLIVPEKEILTKKDNAVETYPGLIRVPFTGSFDNINQLLKGNNLPMVALNYQKTVEDKSVDVSSDWALIAPTQYYQLIIANNPVVTGYYKTTPHQGFNFGQAEADEIATLGKMKFDEFGKELKEQRTNPTTGHFTRLVEHITADSIPGTYQILYNDTFNLTKAVETHFYYKYRNSAGVEVIQTADKTMSEEMFKKFGLRYEFKIVEYNSGKNKTQESRHIWVDTNEKGEYIAYPCQVTAAGERIEGADGKPVIAGRASVGRMPVVRVTILDEKNNVVSYAYIKFEIVEDEVIIEDQDVKFEFNDEIYVDCNQNGYNAALTWSQIENIILINALNNNYSKDTFEDLWKLRGYSTVIAEVKDGTLEEATQFEKMTDKTEFELPTANKKKVGQIQLVADPKATHMQVLQWSLTPEDIYDYFMLHDKNGDIVYVKGKATDANGNIVDARYMQVDPEKVDTKTGLSKVPLETYVLLDGPNKIWVKFTIPVKKFHFAVGSITDNKTLSYWYDLNAEWSTEVNAMQGKKEPKYKELKANVTVPNTQKDDCAFEWDVLAAFDEHKVGGAVKEANKFPSFVGAPVIFTFTTPATAAPKVNAEFNAAGDGTWTVKGNSGATYTVRVGDDNLSVIAIKKNNAAIAEPYDTICAFKKDQLNVIAYKDNLTAKDILNYASHKQTKSEETFTAYVKMTIADCYEMLIPDGSDYFNVKFLRPVDATMKNKDVEDAVDQGSIIDVMDLVDLNDWRDQAFTSDNGITDNNGMPNQQADVTYVPYAQPHYIKYYDVQVAADVDNALSDINKPEGQRVAIDFDKVEANKDNLVVLKKNNPEIGFTFTFKDVTYNTTDEKLEGGTIFYQNISGNINNCHIYVPIKIRYKWGGPGKVTALPANYKFDGWINVGYARITVKKTLSNAKKF